MVDRLTLDNLNDLTKAVDEYGNQFLRMEISFEEFKERLEQRHAEFGCPVGEAYVAWEKLFEHVEEAWNKNNKKPKSDSHEGVIHAQQKFNPTFCVSRTLRKRTTSCAPATNLSTIAEESSSNLSHESINNPQHENRDNETSDLEEPRSKKRREEIPREYLLRRSERVAKFPIVPYFETGHRRRSAPAPNAVKPTNKKNSKVNTRQRTVPAIKPINKKNGKVNTAPRRSRQRVRFEETPPPCSSQQPETPTQEAVEEEEVAPSQEEVRPQIEQEPAPANDSLPSLSTTAEASDSNKLIEAILAQQNDLFKQQNEVLNNQTIAHQQLLKLLESFPKRD